MNSFMVPTIKDFVPLSFGSLTFIVLKTIVFIVHIHRTTQPKLSIGIRKYSDFVKESTAYLINVVSVAFSLSNCSA